MALPSLRPRLLLTAVVAFAAGIASLQAAAWEKNFVSLAPGKFPQPRPVNVRYAFGWGGFTAANVDVRFQKLKNGQFQFEATGATVGLARALWSYDLVHTARANAETLRPVAVKEVETLRTKQKTTELTFTSSGSDERARRPKARRSHNQNAAIRLSRCPQYQLRPPPPPLTNDDRGRRLSSGGLSRHLRLPLHRHRPRPGTPHRRHWHPPTRSSSTCS